MARRPLVAGAVIVLASTATACAPTWWIQGTAMAEAETHVTSACIEDALRASGVERPEAFPMVAGGVGYTVKHDGERSQTIHWDAAHPRELSVTASGSGDLVDEAAITREREARAALLEKLAQACGPFEAHVEEKCDHANCSK